MAEGIGLLQVADELDIVSSVENGPSRERVDAKFDTDAVDRAVEGIFVRALDLDATHRWALNNLGLHLHARSRNDEVRIGRDTRIKVALVRGLMCFLLGFATTL